MFNYVTVFEIGILTLTAICGFLVIYSHALFPLILRHVRKSSKTRPSGSLKTIKHYPSITIVVPAFNEEKFIADKIINLSTLDYPTSKLKIIIYCDGCTDYTALAAEAAMYSECCQDLNIEVIEQQQNIGKIAALNKIIPSLTTDIVALSDVSALLSIDALLIAAQHFEHKNTGFVAATYDFLEYSSAGEEAYWRYQRHIKNGEAAIGSPVGCHGAFYLFRQQLFSPMAEDTINDDFIIPMEILAQGYKGVYDLEIMALELENNNDSQNFNRRIRIARGNVQQVSRLLHLLHPKYKGVALSFFSSKILRAFMPILLIMCLVGTFILSFSQNIIISGVFSVGFIAQILIYSVALFKPLLPQQKTIETLYYLVSGHLAGLIGLYHYITGRSNGKWARVVTDETHVAYSPMAVRIGKRTFDICAAFCGIVVLAPLFPVIALLIKLDSSGPIIFKQKRVGLSTPNVTNIFQMYKFRTMVADAEKNTGAVWAQKNDPRITRMGRFMRKTRLDELPQLWNVLIGDMSVIGPRPERPELYGKLNREIPFFVERNYGVRPGITGPAQVHNGYDETIDDVRNKAGYDHSYALSLGDFKNWIIGDIQIIFQTVGVVVGRRGQ